MSDIKSLADQLRSKIPPAGQETPAKIPKQGPANEEEPVSRPTKPAPATKIPPILELIRSYDNSDHKSMVHVRFDAKTLQTMNQFKMATGVDVTKLVAYAVSELMARHPEIKTIIKQFIQKLD